MDVVLLLAMAANATTYTTRGIATAALLWMPVAGIYQARHGDWKAFALNSPSWRASIAKCGNMRPCDMHAWPGGTDWTFQLYRK